MCFNKFYAIKNLMFVFNKKYIKIVILNKRNIIILVLSIYKFN